jgi:hypothetical protein
VRNTAPARLALALVLAAACQGRAERALLDRFFEASRLRDKTALSAFSSVIFEPHVDGIVTTFEIDRISTDEPSGAGDASLVTRHVTVSAPVRQPDGKTVEKRLVFTLEQTASAGPWKITGLATVPISPS